MGAYDLAAILLDVTRRYDALFGFSMPYIMSMHQEPTVPGYGSTGSTSSSRRRTARRTSQVPRGQRIGRGRVSSTTHCRGDGEDAAGAGGGRRGSVGPVAFQSLSPTPYRPNALTLLRSPPHHHPVNRFSHIRPSSSTASGDRPSVASSSGRRVRGGPEFFERLDGVLGAQREVEAVEATRRRSIESWVPADRGGSGGRRRSRRRSRACSRRPPPASRSLRRRGSGNGEAPK